MTLTIRYDRLSTLKGNERNPKAHDDALIAASIERFGFAEAIVVDDRTGLLVAGHGRVDALRARWAMDPKNPPAGVQATKADWLVPVTHGWASADDAEALAFTVAANMITLAGGWDEKELAGILERLVAGPGLEGVGYDDDEVAALLKRHVEYDPTPSFAGSQGSHAEADLDERLANYRNVNVRSIVLDYPLADYEEAVTLAGEARQRHRVEGNAELFLSMVRAWDSGRTK